MIATPIVLVEDRGVLGLTVSDYIRQDGALLEPYGMNGAVQLLASGRGLRKWLDGQPVGAVRLLLLDFSIVGGASVTILNQLRDPHTGQSLHPALHHDVIVIGWSANLSSVQAFKEAHADGFISKHRPVPQIVTDILAVVQRRRAGEGWVELQPTPR
jgi:DNA-binding NarL/FixJ family response regulator